MERIRLALAASLSSPQDPLDVRTTLSRPCRAVSHERRAAAVAFAVAVVAAAAAAAAIAAARADLIIPASLSFGIFKPALGDRY